MTPSTELTTVALVAAALACGTYGIARRGMRPDSQLFGRTFIDHADPDPAHHTVALTYDDGPSPRNTPELLDLLAQYNARATFFLVGDHVRKHPELARRIAGEGHLIGNHTQTHPNLALLSNARVREELRNCQQTIQDVTGVTPTYFRPPFGARRPDIIRSARALRLLTLLWNVSVKDWEPIGAERMIGKADAGIQANRARRRTSTMLLHDASHLDDDSELYSREDTIRVTATLLARKDLRFTTAARQRRNLAFTSAERLLQRRT